MDKQKLMEEKLVLVWQLNALQEKIDSYWIDIIANNAKLFKEEINKRDRIQRRINEIKKILDE